MKSTVRIRDSFFDPGKPAALLPCALALVVGLLSGCNSIRNGWLDPTVLGNFERAATLEIRSSLTLEDIPPGIPGAELPVREDLEIHPVEYPISGGDTLAVEIGELRQRLLPFQSQVLVSQTGYVNIPVVGRVEANGLTVPEFEDALRSVLQDKGILVDPEVTINPIFLQNATYSIFGIGVSAANNAPLRAGTFPIRRPDLRILEAINQVGGLSEFVTDVYIFRNDTQPWEVGGRREPSGTPGEYAPKRDVGADDDDRFTGEHKSRESEARFEEPDPANAEHALIDAVLGPGEDAGAADDREDPDRPKSGGKNETPDTGDVPEHLAPDPSQPFIYVSNEFVPNPTYRPGAAGGGGPVTESAMPLLDTATPTVNWSRIAGDSNYRVIRVPAEHLRTGDPEMNIVIRAGDVLRIVSGEIGVYYVMGQVNRVGTFAFNAEPITLKAAIAAAGGLSGLAWPDRCTVYRRLGQREQMIQVDLDRIFAGQDSDFLIRRGDIINVGTHPFAPFLQRIRSLTLPNPVSNVGYSFTYARNFADIDSFSVQTNPKNQPDQFPLFFP